MSSYKGKRGPAFRSPPGDGNSRVMSARWPIIAVWTLVVGSALLWASALTRPSNAATAVAPPASLTASMPTDLTRLLGPDPPSNPVEREAPRLEDARLQLVGVLCPSVEAAAHEGLALIAINGRPAKAYRVGRVVDGDTVLQAVEAHSAKLGRLGGATQISLRTTALGSVAAAEPQPSAAPMAFAMPVHVAPAIAPLPTAMPTTSAEGTPPPFGGPPRRAGTR